MIDDRLFNPKTLFARVRSFVRGEASDRGDAPMLIVAWREMTSGESGVSVLASSVSASCTESPSSPTT